jgi:hypothetical protein
MQTQGQEASCKKSIEYMLGLVEEDYAVEPDERVHGEDRMLMEELITY